jgi:peptidoglycan glycosyltransferase
MNKPIRRVAFVAMVMFALLLGNVTYSVLFRQAGLDANSQNRRTRDAEFAQDRGAILATGKVPMAETESTDDRFRFQRVYPDGDLYSVVTGYYSYDHGRTGLENSYNTELAGTDDSLFVRRLVDLVTDRSPEGASVQTTIVPRVQKAATKALGNQKGAVVALDPQTGAVLAMVTARAMTRTRSPATTSRRPTRPGPGWPSRTAARWPTGRRGRSTRPGPPSSW